MKDSNKNPNLILDSIDIKEWVLNDFINNLDEESEEDYILIHNYLDGCIDIHEKVEFEKRLLEDPKFRELYNKEKKYHEKSSINISEIAHSSVSRVFSNKLSMNVSPLHAQKLIPFDDGVVEISAVFFPFMFKESIDLIIHRYWKPINNIFCKLPLKLRDKIVNISDMVGVVEYRNGSINVYNNAKMYIISSFCIILLFHFLWSFYIDSDFKSLSDNRKISDIIRSLRTNSMENKIDVYGGGQANNNISNYKDISYYVITFNDKSHSSAKAIISKNEYIGNIEKSNFGHLAVCSESIYKVSNLESRCKLNDNTDSNIDNKYHIAYLYYDKMKNKFKPIINKDKNTTSFLIKGDIIYYTYEGGNGNFSIENKTVKDLIQCEIKEKEIGNFELNIKKVLNNNESISFASFLEKNDNIPLNGFVSCLK